MQAFKPLIAKLPQNAWQDLQDCVSRLEQARETGDQSAWTSFLPEPDDPHFDICAVELIKVDQGIRWSRGEKEQIEKYLAQCPELRKNDRAVIDLLVGECETRALYGELPAETELIGRFPDLAKHVDFSRLTNGTPPSMVKQRSREEDSGEIDHVSTDIDDPAGASTVIVSANEKPQAAAERIGRYRIEKVLGKGSFGLVYLAHDEQLDRRVAVKVPHIRLVSQPEDA